jgi:hypothetical protein
MQESIIETLRMSMKGDALAMNSQEDTNISSPMILAKSVTKGDF